MKETIIEVRKKLEELLLETESGDIDRSTTEGRLTYCIDELQNALETDK